MDWVSPLGAEPPQRGGLHETGCYLVYWALLPSASRTWGLRQRRRLLSFSVCSSEAPITVNLLSWPWGWTNDPSWDSCCSSLGFPEAELRSETPFLSDSRQVDVNLKLAVAKVTAWKRESGALGVGFSSREEQRLAFWICFQTIFSLGETTWKIRQEIF